ncbi:MAG: biotin/lipoyl-containing protein, partial [Hyphomicrobiaceae bacterium]
MSLIDVKVPDIGDFKNIPVIEVLVKPGDTIAVDAPLVTLESDKATMEVPSSSAGRVVEVLVKVGDRVSEGTAIAKVESAAGAASGSASGAAAAPPTAAESASAPTASAPPAETPRVQKAGSDDVDVRPSGARSIPAPIDFGGVHASPSVRVIARELDIDLTKIVGTGEKGRVTKDDVKRALAGNAAGAASGGGSGIPEIPPQDFAKFGAIETKPLSRLKKLSGPHLHRAWLNIPHVTHTDEADITELEDYRKSLDKAAKDKGYRVTLLSFLMKASVACLKEFPEFNASLSPG